MQTSKSKEQLISGLCKAGWEITFNWLSAWHHFREVTDQLVRVDNKRCTRLFLVLNEECFLADMRLFKQLKNMCLIL